MLRRDALIAAAGMALAVEVRAKTEACGALVVTVGKLDVLPNAANAVTGHVDFMVEMRRENDGALAEIRPRAEAEAARIARVRDLTVAIRLFNCSNPLSTDGRVRRAILKQSTSAGLRTQTMPSGARHDAAWTAGIAPTGMVLIPVLKGAAPAPKGSPPPNRLPKARAQCSAPS